MNTKIPKEGRYFLDPLYGVIYFPDFVWKVIYTPEMQRLRELRLYNINSLYFTGGANINRFEHSVGTCYLAIRFVEINSESISDREGVLLILAALFHDIYNAAFGHTIEYIEEGFSPEDLFFYAATNKKFESYEYSHSLLEPIFFNMYGELLLRLKKDLKIKEHEIFIISEYIQGKGKYGQIISGSIDFDNIDNVYRMSYHMGLIAKTDIPLGIVKSIEIREEKLFYKKESIKLVEQWIKLRERLYKFLLLNPDEFSAKYMLTEAIELSKLKEEKSFFWYDTDFQVLEKLAKTSEETANIITRLMKGNFYGCFGLYETTKTEKYKDLVTVKKRLGIEKKLNDIFRPEVKKHLPSFNLRCQKAIKGIMGISYNANTKIISLNLKMSKHIIESLINNDLKEHKDFINEMYFELNAKYLSFKLKFPSLGIHTLLDVNKTNRCVKIDLSSKKTLNIGYSSKSLYIGVFIKNIEFANFNICNNNILSAKTVTNIKQEIRKFLMDLIEDKELKEINLYSESKYEK